VNTPAERFEIVRRLADLDLDDHPVLVPSYSNDTWYVASPSAGEAVLRVCWIGDPDRLLREAAVGAAAPDEVGYPAVLGSGRLELDGRVLTWLITRRLSGRTLLAAWPELTPEQQSACVARIGSALDALHGWRPPSEVARLLTPPAPTDDPVRIIGASLLPLPLDRARRLLAPARAKAPTYAALIDRAAGWVEEHADLLPRLDDPRDAVIHGDLHLSNIWWDGTGVAGLLDLEWVRFGPAWLDLSRVRDNALAGDAGAGPHAQLLAALRARMPGPATSDLDDRLTAAQLVLQIRDVAIWPAAGPEPAIDHPVRVIGRLLALAGA
jgi:aminoglycoside phosphotransferase (APT) family kinase protein